MQAFGWIKKHWMEGILWGIVAGFTVLYLSLIFNTNIWTDEAFTIQLLKGNFSEIIAGTAEDVHPPFYYLYLKVFTMLFGDSLQVMKIASILPMTATLVLGATIIRKRFGNETALLYLLFFTCMPCTMEFAVQVRMYSLAVLFVTGCGIFAFLAFEEGRKRDFALFGICGVLAAYTHYFAFMAVIVIAGLLFLAILVWNRKRIRAWGISAAAMILAYLPWLPVFINQVVSVRKGYWISEITVESVWGYFEWTFGLSIVPGTVFLFLLLLKAVSTYNVVRITLYKSKVDIYALLCMLVPALTTITGVIISTYKTPIYRDQYIFPALGLLALFFGIGLRKAKKILLVLVSGLLLLIGAGQYKECHYQEYSSTLWPQTQEFFAENLSPNDYIVYNYELYDFIYECYFPEDQLAYLENFDFSGDFNIVWFLDTMWMPEIDPAVLEQNGLTIEAVGHYGIEHNEFDLYMIFQKQDMED